MSSFLERRTPRSDNNLQLENPLEDVAHKEQSTAASEPYAAERTRKAGTQFFPDLTEERINDNLEPLHDHFSALTQMKDKSL